MVNLGGLGREFIERRLASDAWLGMRAIPDRAGRALALVPDRLEEAVDAASLSADLDFMGAEGFDFAGHWCEQLPARRSGSRFVIAQEQILHPDEVDTLGIEVPFCLLPDGDLAWGGFLDESTSGLASDILAAGAVDVGVIAVVGDSPIPHGSLARGSRLTVPVVDGLIEGLGAILCSAFHGCGFVAWEFIE